MNKYVVQPIGDQFSVLGVEDWTGASPEPEQLFDLPRRYPTRAIAEDAARSHAAYHGKQADVTHIGLAA